VSEILKNFELFFENLKNFIIANPEYPNIILEKI